MGRLVNVSAQQRNTCVPVQGGPWQRRACLRFRWRPERSAAPPPALLGKKCAAPPITTLRAQCPRLLARPRPSRLPRLAPAAAAPPWALSSGGTARLLRQQHRTRDAARCRCPCGMGARHHPRTLHPPRRFILQHITSIAAVTVASYCSKQRHSSVGGRGIKAQPRVGLTERHHSQALIGPAASLSTCSSTSGGRALRRHGAPLGQAAVGCVPSAALLPGGLSTAAHSSAARAACLTAQGRWRWVRFRSLCERVGSQVLPRGQGARAPRSAQACPVVWDRRLGGGSARPSTAIATPSHLIIFPGTVGWQQS